jgi:hypothetical protein
LGKSTATCVSEEMRIRNIMEAILAKKGYATNLVDSQETMQHTEDAVYNPAFSNVQFPDKELITNSLRKIDLIISTAHMLWPKKIIAEKIIADAVSVINQVCQRNFSFCNGKALKSILAGLFYILSFRYDDPKKQREIGAALKITDVTVRSSYKQWAKDFPDLFQDVINVLNQRSCNCRIGSNYHKKGAANI